MRYTQQSRTILIAVVSWISFTCLFSASAFNLLSSLHNAPSLHRSHSNHKIPQTCTIRPIQRQPKSDLIVWSSAAKIASRTSSSSDDKLQPLSKKKDGNDVKNEEKVPTTMPAAIRRFFFGKDIGPLCIVASIVLLINYRIGLIITSPLNPLTLSPFDALSASLAIVFWWFQEHFAHGHLLHSKFDWMGKRIHEGHHEKHYFHISIDPPELIMGWLIVVHFFLRCVLPVHLATSATIGYATAGLFYEFAHYIVHTKVRFKTNTFLKRMKDHHIRHHLVNDKYWLGFSVPAVDDLFRTNPSVAEARREVVN